MKLVKSGGLLALVLTMAVVQFGCGKAKQVAGIGNFTVDTSNNTLAASVELTLFRTTVGLSVPVPKINEAFVNFGPSPDGKGSVLAFTAPIPSLISSVDNSLPSRGLPDGRPLVGTSPATLPSFDLAVGTLSLRFYLAADVFGVFIPIPLPSFPEPIQFPVKDTRGYVVAYATAIPPSSGTQGGGVLILFPIVANQGLMSL